MLNGDHPRLPIPPIASRPALKPRTQQLLPAGALKAANEAIGDFWEASLVSVQEISDSVWKDAGGL